MTQGVIAAVMHLFRVLDGEGEKLLGIGLSIVPSAVLSNYDHVFAMTGAMEARRP